MKSILENTERITELFDYLADKLKTDESLFASENAATLNAIVSLLGVLGTRLTLA
jgi:hypothetical protein